MAAPPARAIGSLGFNRDRVLAAFEQDFFGTQLGLVERIRDNIRFRTIVIEDVSPTIQGMQATWPRHWVLIGEMIGRIVEDNIRKAYYSGPERWAELKDTTMARKIRDGTPYGLGPRAELQWWLGLRGDVEDNLHVYAIKTPRSGVQIVLSPQSFAHSPYVMFHEFGTRFMPRRSFIQDGIRDSQEEISNLIAGWVGIQRHMLRHPQEHSIPKRVWGERLPGMPNIPGFSLGRYLPGLNFWLWLLVPPNALLRYLAIAGDISSILRGSWTSAATETYVQNFLLGQFGLTKKAVRRRIRRRIWNRVLR